jgi:transposase
MNKRKWMQKKRVALTPLQARKRLDWAIRYQGIDWRRVKWSDECMVRRGQGLRPIWTFLSPREALRVQDVREARRQGAVRQMFWAAFCHGSRTPLVPLVGNVNAIGIYELYSFILPWFLQSGDIFMHDNASVHTARVVKSLLEDLGVDLMAWPPYSPDLNPIENLWALMKAEIYRLHPELTHAEDTVAIQHALVLAAMEAWDNLEDRILKNLCETMPNRVNAVIDAEGWYTKY